MCETLSKCGPTHFLEKLRLHVKGRWKKKEQKNREKEKKIQRPREETQKESHSLSTHPVNAY